MCRVRKSATDTYIWKEGMDIEIKYLKRKQLFPYLPKSEHHQLKGKSPKKAKVPQDDTNSSKRKPEEEGERIVSNTGDSVSSAAETTKRIKLEVPIVTSAA